MHTQNLCTEGKYDIILCMLNYILVTSNTLLLKPSPSNLNFVALTKMNLEEKRQKLIDKILYMKQKTV